MHKNDFKSYLTAYFVFVYIACFKYNSIKKVGFFKSRPFVICFNVTLVVQIFCFLVNFDNKLSLTFACHNYGMKNHFHNVLRTITS